MSIRRELVKVELDKGKLAYVEVAVSPGEEEVAAGIMSLDGVADALEGISKIIIGAVQSAKPQKASVEFGLEVAVESGKLTALLVKGSGTATLKIALEWDGKVTAA